MREAMKFENKNFHGIASLFWDQKAQSKDKKKFDYKSRNMKFPIRGNNAVGPTNDPRKVQPTRKPNSNNKVAPGTVQRPNRSTDNRVPDAKQKTKVSTYTKPKKHPFAEGVTLTKAQLEAILDSVRKLPAADESQSTNNESYLKEEKVDAKLETNLKPAATTNQDSSHVVKNGETSSTKEVPHEHQEKELKEDPPQYSREASEKNSTSDPQTNVLMNTEANKTHVPTLNDLAKPTKPFPAIQPLSLSERKRQQWQREKAEQLQLYDPWGKPGAGAPLLDTKGQVITNYKVCNSQRLILTNGQAGFVGNIPSDFDQQANLPSPTQISNSNFAEPSHLVDACGQTCNEPKTEPSQSAELTGKSFADQSNQVDSDRTKSSRPVAVVPAAMRSSFQIGYNEIPDYERIRVDEKRKWLMELEKQKEEHRLRKQDEKEKNNLLLDSNHFTQDASFVTQRNDGQSHLLSRLNLHMDPVTQQELELKKRKNKALMLEIQEQINEQQKQKLFELQKQQLAEAADEKRLLEEQRLLNLQYKYELLNEKQKMEAKEEQLKQLAATIDQAREEAILDKKLKRIQYLEKNGHDTSRLQADLAATCQSLLGEQSKKDIWNASLASENTASSHPDETVSKAKKGIPIQLPYQPKIRDVASQTDSWLLSKLSELSDVEIEYESKEEISIPVEKKNIANVKPSVNKGKKPSKVQERSTLDHQNTYRKNSVNKSDHLSRQGREKNVSSQKNGSMVTSKDKREIHQKLNSGLSKNPGITTKPPKQSSVSQRARLGDQQNKMSRQVKAGGNQSSTNSHRRQGQENRLKERLPRDPSPSARRKKVAEAEVTMKPTVEPVISRERRGVSPPVPALRRKLKQEIDKGEQDIQMDTYNYDHIKSVSQQARPVRKTNKYADVQVDSQSPHTDFIPFTRTSEVLDPAYADSPLPISREQSSILRGRESYWKGQHPGNFGDSVEHFTDQTMSDHEKSYMKTSLEATPLSEKEAFFQKLSDLKQKPSTKTSLEEASLDEKEAFFQKLSDLKQKLQQMRLETNSPFA